MVVGGPGDVGSDIGTTILLEKEEPYLEQKAKIFNYFDSTTQLYKYSHKMYCTSPRYLDMIYDYTNASSSPLLAVDQSVYSGKRASNTKKTLTHLLTMTVT